MKNTIQGIITILVLFPLFSFGQGEANNWYFGQGAGIRFNVNGSVTAVTDGRLNTLEGCATISDSDGNLVLYTDGITVYNGNHQIMQNGNGLFGDPSSTQSALVVPNQADPNIYYIFTVDTSVGQGDPNYGLNYSIVDISANNGNGAVTSKNRNLLPFCSEKITAVLKDCFTKSVWVISLSSENGRDGLYNTYYAYEVNDNGIVSTPVKTTVPAIADDQRGYLKLSPDGTKMASANVNRGLYLYDFDATTGSLSNEQRINVSAKNKAPYGIEFSPNNELLYVHTFNPDFNAPVNSSNLLQYDLTVANISGSEVNLDERDIYRGALQLGPNGKIYRSLSLAYQQGTQYLGVINNPNQRGTAAGYQHNAVNLQGRMATQGLPPFVQSFFAKTELVKNADGSTSPGLTVCEGGSFTLETDPMPGATYIWTLNDVPITGGTNILIVNNVTPAEAGVYKLEIDPANPSDCSIIGEALIEVNPRPFITNSQLIQCDLDTDSPTASSDGYTAFNLEQASAEISGGISGTTVQYYASITDRDNENEITNPIGYINTTATNQIIYTKVTNNLGCTAFGELTLQVQPTTASLNLTSQPPFYACDIDAYDTIENGIFDLDDIKAQTYPNLDIMFYASLEDASLELNPLSGSYTSETAILYARLESSNQCQGIEEISLIVQPTPEVKINDEYYLCTDNPTLEIRAENGFDDYRWYRTEGNTEVLISNSDLATITEIGNYRLDLIYSYNNNQQFCLNSKEFVVTPSNIAVIKNVEIRDIRSNNTLTVLVTGDGDYEYALDDINGPYQNSNIFENVQIGFRDIYVRDKKGCGINGPHTVSVIGYPKMFTPNGDQVNDTWQLEGVNAQFQVNSKIFIFDRYGALVTKITPTSKGWDGNYRGKPVPESDYWFRVKLEDGRDFNGHFALKR